MLKTNKTPRPRLKLSRTQTDTVTDPVRIRIRVRKNPVKKQETDRFLPKDQIKRDVRGMFSSLGVAVYW